MPLFAFAYSGLPGFRFSGNQFSIERLDPRRDVPDVPQFSRGDIACMQREQWALVFDHDDATSYKTDANLLLLAFRVFSRARPPFIKYRLCSEDHTKCRRLTSTFTYIHEFESRGRGYTEEDLAVINRHFVALARMDAISGRCHNALYFLFLGFIRTHWMESFLHWVNTLEALFSKDEPGSATETICGRVSSFLESHEGAEYQDIKRLYETRSAIVHGRIVADEEPLKNLEQLHRLQSVTLGCVRRILEEKVYLKFTDSETRNAYLSTLDQRGISGSTRIAR